MNFSGFILRKLGTQLGIITPRRFIRQAGDDAAMLYEAEGIIGGLAWRQLENAEEVSAEYWKLRLIENETRTLKQRLKVAEQDRLNFQGREDEIDPELQQAYERGQRQLDALIAEHQKAIDVTAELISQSDALRHHYSGLKLKLRVLRDERAAPAEQEAVRNEMAALRRRYDELAQHVAAAQHNAAQKEQQVHNQEDKQEALQLEARRRQQEVAREITERNRRIVEIKARISVFNSEKEHLLHTIGKILCTNLGNSQDLQKARQRLASMISKTRRLKRSIDYQKRLGEIR